MHSSPNSSRYVRNSLSNHSSSFLNNPNPLPATFNSHTASRQSLFEAEEKDHSSRSFSTSKTASKYSYKISELIPAEPQASLLQDELQNYTNIQRILKDENSNLKRQNELLLREVHKLKQKGNHYREQYRNAKLEIQAVRLECEAQKKRADEMKDIVMNRLMELEERVQGNMHGFAGLSIGQCDSFLEVLTFSESQIK